MKEQNGTKKKVSEIGSSVWGVTIQQLVRRGSLSAMTQREECYFRRIERDKKRKIKN